jgi:hypothetical protein
MNGKQGDDPLMDILTHNVGVFAPDIDELIREISAMGGFESPMAIAYVRAMHDLLAWPAIDERRSDYDKARIRRSQLAGMKEVLQEELDWLREERSERTSGERSAPPGLG